MDLKSLATDYVTIEKPNGAQISGVQAHVQPDLVIIPDAEVPLEEGDLITRRLRSGIEEIFEIVDRGFYDVPGGEAHYQAKVKRVRERRAIQRSTVDNRKVFVVHGRNELARRAMNDFLRSIDLRPIEWSEAMKLTGEAAPFVGSVVEAGFGAAQAVVVLLTGDDLAKLSPDLLISDDPSYEKELTPQARPNVLFEAGFAFGRHPTRTVIVELGQLRPFSDVQGRHVIRMNNSAQKRQDLADRLRTAGCAVDTSGYDWHTAGDFEQCSPPPNTETSSERRKESIPRLSDDAAELLLEAAKDSSGVVQRTESFAGLDISSNGRSFVDGRDPRAEARWDAALEELSGKGMVRDKIGKGEVFWLTKTGYETADSLSEGLSEILCVGYIW